MYIMNKALAKELKDGRTLRYIAKQLGVTENFVCSIFNGNKGCSLLIAKSIISIRYSIPVNHDLINSYLSTFFIKKEQKSIDKINFL